MKIIFAISLLFLFACVDSALPSGVKAGSFNLANKEHQKEVIVILKSLSIPYQIGDEGEVTYMLYNFSEVQGVIRTVRYGDELNPYTIESEVLINEEEEKKYIEIFTKNNIPYDIDTHENIRHISWSQSYGPEVDKIRQRVMEERRYEAAKVGARLN